VRQQWDIFVGSYFVCRWVSLGLLAGAGQSYIKFDAKEKNLPAENRIVAHAAASGGGLERRL
jgi:hypothetical protein